MRAILFRGKRIDNGEWVEGDLVHNAYDASSRTLPVAIRAQYCWPHEVIPETVGQLHNSLSDRAGFKLFEDDIIKHELYEGLGHPETFCNNYKDTVRIERSFNYYKDIKLLGNIHDNPELLKS